MLKVVGTVTMPAPPSQGLLRAGAAGGANGREGRMCLSPDSDALMTRPHCMMDAGVLHYYIVI